MNLCAICLESPNIAISFRFLFFKFFFLLLYRLINGVFENYLSQKMPNSNFFSIAEAIEWFCFSDLLQTQIHTLQNYTVYPYLPYGFAAWHLQFSSITWPKITFPTQGYEVGASFHMHVESRFDEYFMLGFSIKISFSFFSHLKHPLIW